MASERARRRAPPFIDPPGYARWEGEVLRNYAAAEGLAGLTVQWILEDRAGRIWAGGGNGLYCLEGERFVHVTRDGPWK